MTGDNHGWLIPRSYYRRSVYSIGKRESNAVVCKSRVQHGVRETRGRGRGSHIGRARARARVCYVEYSGNRGKGGDGGEGCCQRYKRCLVVEQYTNGMYIEI